MLVDIRDYSNLVINNNEGKDSSFKSHNKPEDTKYDSAGVNVDLMSTKTTQSKVKNIKGDIEESKVKESTEDYPLNKNTDNLLNK